MISTSRTSRTVLLADHLWEALEQMSREMGVDRDMLVSQAVFTLARLNGYLVPGKVTASESVRHENARDVIEPVSPTVQIDSEVLERPVAASPAPDLEVSSLRRRTEAGDRVAAINGAVASQVRLPRSPSSESDKDGELPPPLPGNEALGAGLERTNDNEDAGPSYSSAAATEESVEASATHAGASPLSPDAAEPSTGEVEAELYLHIDGNDPVPVVGDRVVIGRGKHCDLILTSNRVSREHAVISRIGSQIVIEDLNSSNGTWIQQQKITRHALSDGDEFMLGNVHVRCELTRPKG